jgi:hypothetical protein
MRTPDRGQLEATEFDAKNCREDSAGSLDTCSLVLDSIFYTKVFWIVQGGNQKSYGGARRDTAAYRAASLARRCSICSTMLSRSG